MKHLVCAIALLFLLPGALGCGGSQYMTEVETPRVLAANPQAATLVFVRPSSYGGRSFPILDGRGAFLGEVTGDTYFVTTVPPGEHMFVAWSEGTPALKATVEAGRIYYIEVGVTIGAWSPRARLFAVGPQRPQWAELPEWLGETSLLVHNANAAQLFAQEEGSEIAEVVQKGINNYAEYDAEERAQRTLLPTDGVPTPVPARGD